MAISFNSIPANIRTVGQYIEFDSSRAVQGTPAKPHKALVIGQILAAGTMTVETLYHIASASVGETLAGRGSILDAIIKAYKDQDPTMELWAIGVDDSGTAVDATGTFAITGPATADGTFYAYVAGHRFAVAVSDTDTATDIGDALAAAINADTECPATAANVTGTVTCTARNGGTVGNGIDLRVNYYDGEDFPAGVGCTVTGMASGANDPDLTNALAAMADEQWDTIVVAPNDTTNLGLVDAELDSRWGPMVQKEGHCYTGGYGNQSTLTTQGNAENSEFITIVGAGLSPTPWWEWAARVAAIDAYQTTIDPARPRQTLKVDGVLAPHKSEIFTRAERNILLTDGIATYTVGSDGSVYIERLITTYQTNPASVADTAYLDVVTMRTLAYLRYSMRTRVALRYPRHKLADDGTRFGPGQAIVTPSILRTTLLQLFGEWETDGLVEGFEQFKTELIVERNANDPNRIDVLAPPDLINQFRVLAAQIQFLV